MIKIIEFRRLRDNGSCEDVVISGLSITPSDIERLARQGVPVSVPNASSFFLLILVWKSPMALS